LTYDNRPRRIPEEFLLKVWVFNFISSSAFFIRVAAVLPESRQVRLSEAKVTRDYCRAITDSSLMDPRNDR